MNVLETTQTPTPTANASRRSLLDMIGNTPLLSFDRITQSVAPVRVFAKAEWYNPGGSVKDRPARGMILDGEKRGLLNRDKTLIDASSGNTGIAYAMICAHRGYRCVLVLPADATEERKKILLAYGAELVLTDAAQGTDGAQLYVKRMVAENPEKYFYPDQYNNNANWGAHYATTGPEIWRQTDGAITHFVTGLGTTGTFMGVTRRLREFNPRIRCINTHPDIHEHEIPGMKHMPSNIVPGIYDPKLADEFFTVASRDAQRTVVRLAREEGLLVGVSSGANMWAALKVAARAKAAGMNHAVVVTVFPDSAFKYLSQKFWQD